MADSIIDKLKQQFRQGSVLLKLIYINVAIFLLLRLTWVVLMLFNIDGYVILPFIEMPSIPYEFITHPWTLLTYMFVHYDVWHILFNMLWLYWFGQIFLMSFSEKQMVGLYLLGGIAGGLLYLLSYNLFPYFDGKEGLMCGASASIIAIVVATAFRMPDYKVNLLFLGAISLKYIALVTIVIDLLRAHRSPRRSPSRLLVYCAMGKRERFDGACQQTHRQNRNGIQTPPENQSVTTFEPILFPARDRYGIPSPQKERKRRNRFDSRQNKKIGVYLALCRRKEKTVRSREKITW